MFLQQYIKTTYPKEKIKVTINDKSENLLQNDECNVGHIKDIYTKKNENDNSQNQQEKVAKKN